MESKKITEVLHKIQKQLNAPKSRYNTFGKYNYRSCEDIVEAVKKVMPGGYALLMSDDIIMHGEHVYVKASVAISGAGEEIVVTGCAREALVKKGMDPSQMTGTASSYARKYALNGLLAIDDTKDADTDEHKTEYIGRAKKRDDDDVKRRSREKTSEIIGFFSECKNQDDINDIWAAQNDSIAFIKKNYADLYNEIENASEDASIRNR